MIPELFFNILMLLFIAYKFLEVLLLTRYKRTDAMDYTNISHLF